MMRIGKTLGELARRRRFFVSIALKSGEANWLEDEAERLGVAQSVIVRHALQRFQENAPAHLPWDREIVTHRKGVIKVVKVDIDEAAFVKGESWRLATSQSDLVRQAIVRLRAEGALSISRPTNRKYWWKGRSWLTRVRRGVRSRRGISVHRVIGALFGNRR